MKRVMGLVIFLFFLATGCWAEQPDFYTWDFGQVKEGEVVAHSFTLKNDSVKALKITGVNTSCGCTVSEVKRETLSAQESTLVEVKFNSKGYSGAVQQFVYVNTDNLDKPVIKFIIKANVVK
ncbi:MAG: DUF1573 domain-containing protein [Candidatus Omnitrophica bacterium]|nr:DUF1573 domain-containing protein [Candidatus Omnitrophota bacterium]